MAVKLLKEDNKRYRYTDEPLINFLKSYNGEQSIYIASSTDGPTGVDWSGNISDVPWIYINLKISSVYYSNNCWTVYVYN